MIATIGGALVGAGVGAAMSRRAGRAKGGVIGALVGTAAGALAESMLSGMMPAAEVPLDAYGHPAPYLNLVFQSGPKMGQQCTQGGAMAGLCGGLGGTTNVGVMGG